MTDLAREVAEAFGLSATGPPTAIERDDQTTGVWRLGDVVIKRVRWDVPDWWVPRAIASLDLELAAIAAGLRAPAPLLPAGDGIGPCAIVDDIPYRAHAYVPSRTLLPDDDIGSWLYDTLARLHSVGRPSEAPEPGWYGLHPVEDWNDWIDRAADAELPWAEHARVISPAIAALSARVEGALRGREWHVAHRDVNPWNVAISADGPVLFDFDAAGPDVLELESHGAADAFGLVDVPTPEIAVRRAGNWLMWTAFNVWRSLGDRPATALERDAATRIVQEQLSSIPDLAPPGI